MSVKRSRPGVSTVRKGKCVGPDYPEGHFTAPWNQNIDHPYGEARDDKAIMTEAGETFEFDDAGLNKGGYNKLWEGK